MASTYRRGRVKKAARMVRRLTRVGAVGEAMMLSGGGVAVTLGFLPALGVIAAGSILKAGATGGNRIAKRDLMRKQVVARLVENTQRSKGAAASIARARGVLAKTAASRSAAASRTTVPRPVGQRRLDNSQQRGDGQTDGYYRNQAGRRVFVKGYNTPTR